MEDISDRELERLLQENISAKWFCDFDLTETTPDFRVFSKVRKKIGTNKLADIFANLRPGMVDTPLQERWRNIDEKIFQGKNTYILAKNKK